MTPARPVFGEFISAARRHLTAAAAPHTSATPGRDASEQASALARLSAVLTRYTADLTRTISDLPDEHFGGLGPWDQAALRAHWGLVSACRALGQRDYRSQNPTEPAQSPTGRSLHAAATSMAAGRDLLQGHFTTEPSGARLYRSGWAPAITSPGVSRALLTDIALLASQAAAAASEIAATAPRDLRTDGIRRRIGVARYWLTQPDSLVQAAQQLEPAAASGREVLHAVPENIMPARPEPGSTQSVQELCAAVITTAERARAAAWDAASAGPTSREICSTSWYRIAAASTQTSHHCHLLYTTLAERAAEQDSELAGLLMRAARRAERAREYWLDSAREFRDTTTDIQKHVSPAAAEAGDLALWTGRLTYADPGWILSTGPAQLTRSARTLAPRLFDVPGVVAAVHEASDALGGLATANLEQARQAVAGRRLFVATRSLPESYDIPARYTEAPEPYAASLLACCRDTARQAGRAAETGSEIAARTGAPSRTLTALRTAMRERPDSPSPARPSHVDRADAEPAQTGPVEDRLRSLGIDDVRHLWRASAIDRAADQVIQEANATRGHSSPRDLELAIRQNEEARATNTDRGEAALPPQLEAEP